MWVLGNKCVSSTTKLSQRTTQKSHTIHKQTQYKCVGRHALQLLHTIGTCT